VEQCATVKTGFKRVLTYQSKLCHVKSRIKTNYEAVYYRQTHLMNVLSDIKNWNITWARYMFSAIRTYIPAYGYIMWLEVMHETEEPACIGNSEG